MASSTELAQSTPLAADAGVMHSDGTGSRFMPYHSPHHQPAKGRYITSNDPRGYIPVYEYPLNGQWIMMDMDDGYILWTGIWKALGNHKADIVKMLESQPELATQLRRVRGGYLKIQGTWLAYEVALRLARRVGWPIRHDLVPLFGPTFPTTCLAPDQPGYGTVIPPTGRRKPRRSLQSVGIPPPHTAPYPPKLPLAKELSYNAGRYIEGTSQGHMRPHLEAGHLRAPHGPLSTSPTNPHTVPFAPPVIPAVPALVPSNGVAYSVPEPLGASQYTTSAPTYSPVREYPSKARYSPYMLPRRHYSPPSTMSGYIIPSPLGYDQQHTRLLVHRASDPNLRSLHSHGHAQAHGLSVNTHQLLPARDTKRPLPSLSSAPDGAEFGGDESQRFGMTEEVTGEGYGASSGDSVRSSIPTPPFSEVGGPAYDHGWQIVPTPIDVGAQWPETPGDFSTTYEGSHYFTDSASYSDPSSISPRTTWSYDGYGRHSPSERHYQYNHLHPMHHHYSSISSTTSFGERRVSMADSIASSFPEPDMPLPQMSHHRYSQPHLHNPIPSPHLEMWMRERSGSFAEASYSLQRAQQEHSNQEMVESYSMAPSQEYTSSPQLVHSPEHRRSSSHGSTNGVGHLPRYSPQEGVAAW